MKVYSDNIDNSKVELPIGEINMILRYTKLSFIMMICITVTSSILLTFFGFFIVELYTHVEQIKAATTLLVK